MRREEIERLDFPAARRGYDRAAVDGHLARVADQVERLEERAGNASPTLADTAGKRVASVIGAAERKAAEIEAEARRDARTELAAAREEARRLVQGAEDAVEGLVREAEKLRSRVRVLGERLSDGAGPLRSETEPVTVPEPEPPEREIDPSPAIVPEPSPEPVPEPTPDPVPEPIPSPQPAIPPQPTVPTGPMAKTNGDASGARLIAMKMALDGASRDEVERHLASSYELPAVDELVDDVFAHASR